ncbi:hypothetical protein NEIRO03_0010 [Nematocida sp. AWRm78]|nr:hypothetical protein NEIRO03_0010 [Nematocida sp. AWRm78]
MTNRNSRMEKEKKQLEADIDSVFYSQREYKKENSKDRPNGEKKPRFEKLNFKIDQIAEEDYVEEDEIGIPFQEWEDHYFDD